MFGLFPPNLGVAPVVTDTFPHNGYKRYIQRYAPSTSLQLGTVPYMVLPIFIRNDWLRTVANGGVVQSALGWDVRFETPEGIKRPHEDISYDGIIGQKAAWVRFENIGAGTDINLYCYCGKAGLTGSEEDPTACWVGYLASIEFASGIDKSNHGASLTLSGVTATTLIGQQTMSFYFQSTILPAGLFATGIPAGGADAIITSTGDTLVTSDGNRLIVA